MAVGVLVWWLSLSDIALGQMTDFGLGSVLPAGTWVSFGLVTAGFGLAWWFGSDTLIAAGILVTILVLFGLGVFGEPTMRFATTWQHVGIADHIATHGSINPNIDAYFNWPGFFILSAFISNVTGLKNIEPIARAAPLFFNVMYFIALVSIGRSLFTDRRVIWLGVWLFFINNWIGQDYYSPQGAGFFLYLVLMAVLLRWFKGMPHSPDSQRRWWYRLGIERLTRLPRALSRRASIPADVPSTPPQRVVLILAIAMIVTVAVTSHQFTPAAMVASTAALSLIGWCRLRTLPVAIALTALVCAAFIAVPYLAGHLHSLLGSVGAVSGTVNSNVGGRLNGTGSSGHELIVKVRLFTTALLWIVAALGFLKQARAARLNLGLLALAVAAFPLLALQSYGGEVVLRIALFSMPYMALAAATLFVPVNDEVPMSKTALAALGCFCLVLIALFPFNRYGNERMDYFPPDEIAGVQAMYRLAPKGSYLYSPDYSLPWRYENYADYYYDNSLTSVNLDLMNPRALARAVAQFMTPPADSGARAFLIITSTTNAENDLFGPFKRGADNRLRRILSASRYFRLLYHNPDAAVFELK